MKQTNIIRLMNVPVPVSLYGDIVKLIPTHSRSISSRTFSFSFSSSHSSIYLSVCLLLHTVCPSVYLSVCQFACLSVSLSVFSVCLFVCLCICLSVCLLLLLCLSVYLSVCLSVFSFSPVYLSVCLYAPFLFFCASVFLLSFHTHSSSLSIIIGIVKGLDDINMLLDEQMFLLMLKKLFWYDDYCLL